MNFGSRSVLAVAIVAMWGSTEAWLQQPLIRSAARASPASAAVSSTSLHMYMGARNSTTRGSSMNSRHEVLEEEPATTTKATNPDETTRYDKNVNSFSADMQDQLKELEQVNHHVEQLDLHQKEHFLVSDTVEDELNTPEQVALPELVDSEFVVSDNIQMDAMNERSQTIELPILIDDEFVVSENIYLDENHDRSQRMGLPKAEMSVDVTQDFHISENMEDTKAEKMELPKIVDNVFIVSDNIQSDENNDRSKKMELPPVETSVDVTQDFYISENMEDRKAQKMELPVVTNKYGDNEDNFVVSDNLEDTKPITVVDKDFRISDPIISGDGEPVKMPELVDGEFLVSENIQSQDRARSKRVKIAPALPALEFLDNLKDMDLVPPIKLNVKEEDMQKMMGIAQERAKNLIDLGRVVVTGSVAMAHDVKKSLPSTTLGKREETYEEALQKVGKGATGLWTLMKEFGGFVKETAAQVDLAQAESMMDGLKEQAASTMEIIQTNARSVRIPVVKTVNGPTQNQVEVEEENNEMDLPYFLKLK